MAKSYTSKGDGARRLIGESATQHDLGVLARPDGKQNPERQLAPARSSVGNSARPTAASLATILAIGFVLAPGSNCLAQGTASSRGGPVSQPIAPFRLTGVEGYLALRYFSDEYGSSSQAGGAGSRSRQTSLSEELFIMTHSYIYHPTLLMLDLGGGPIIDKLGYDTNGVTTNSTRQAFNLSARATILRDKPYNGTLFYDRRTDTQNLGSSQQLATENQRYGATVRLLGPVTPVPTELTISRSTNKGSGVALVVDDKVDQLTLRMATSLGTLGGSTLNYVVTRQDSATGTPSLPITANHIVDDRLTLDTNIRLGAKKEYELNNVITLHTNKQSAGEGAPLVEQQDANFALDFRGRHSDQLQTYARYNLALVKLREQKTTANSLGAGVNYSLNPDLFGSLGARLETTKSDQVASTFYGLDGWLNYRQALWVGQGTAGYNLAYNWRDQKVSATEAPVVQERVTLTSGSFSNLAKTQINRSSVVVRNLTFQVLVEDSDYKLDTLGLRLRITRVAGSSNMPLDGDVLVDYSYATGGSYAASQFDNSFNLGWAYKNYLSVYMRYTNSAVSLISGEPTSPLNPAKSIVFGAHGDLPLSILAHGFQLGANAEREDRREVVMPYKRTSLDAHIVTDVPMVRNGTLWLGTRRLKTDYDLAPTQGVDLIGYEMRLGMNLGYGVDLSAETTHVRDTGRPLVSENTTSMIKAKWRRRKLQATFDLRRERDAQGDFERTRTYAQFIVRRDF